MIYFLGFVDDRVVLFNSVLYEFKSLNKFEFLKFLTKKEFKDLKSLEPSALKLIINKIEFPLENKEDLVEGILYDKKCQYFLEIQNSTYMTVATCNLKAEIVKRIDNENKTLNSETFWMTWSESKGYVYGTSVSCSAFEYVCELGRSYLDAKAELLDFANTGLQEMLERQMMFGIETGYQESTSLKGLCSYKLINETDITEEGVLEIEEGVTVLDAGAIPKKCQINKLILPSTLMFIQPNAIQGNISVIDMSKTSVTKLYCPINYIDVNCEIKLPKKLIELTGLCSNRYGYIANTIHTILPKSVAYIRDLNNVWFEIEKDSNLVYLGSESLSERHMKRVPASVYNCALFDDMSKSTCGYVLDTPHLQTIEGDVVYDDTKRNSSLKTIIFVSGKLNRMMKSYYTKLNSSNILFYVEKYSELYNEVHNKIDRLYSYTNIKEV